MGRHIDVSLTLVVVLCVVLAGCGSGTPGAMQTTALEASTPCITCHSGVRSHITGDLVVEEWRGSGHNVTEPDEILRGIRGASCRDCHEPAPGHPNACNQCHNGPTPTQYEVTRNPDASGKCLKCHGDNHPDDVMWVATPKHFGNLTASINNTAYRASYYSSEYQGACRRCHNPHNPSRHKAYNRSWAKSTMADTESPARRSDFKFSGTGLPANLAYPNSTCVRCHTTTGFLHFVQSGFSDLRPFGSRDTTNNRLARTKELTNCDACHTDYSFSPRRVPPVTLYLNFSAAGVKINNNAVIYDDYGISNMCIPCHGGRAIGSLVKEMALRGVDFSNASIPGAHNFPAAITLMGKGGYEFPGQQYATGVGADTGHDRLGLASGRGPCVTCHMTRSQPADSHLFSAVVHGKQFDLFTTNQAWSQVYSISNTRAFPASLTIDSIASRACSTSACHASLTAAQLTADKEGYISALAVLNKWLRLVRYVPVNPQAAVSGSNKARDTKKWEYLGLGSAPSNLMGAAFNLATLEREPGAYVHRPLYVKRLVYDSLYFVSTTATDPTLTDPVNFRYQYPQHQQTNVADAIQFLVTPDTAAVDTSGPVRISQHQADAAIKWLYGKNRTDATLVKSSRPGD